MMANVVVCLSLTLLACLSSSTAFNMNSKFLASHRHSRPEVKHVKASQKKQPFETDAEEDEDEDSDEQQEKISALKDVVQSLKQDHAKTEETIKQLQREGKTLPEDVKGGSELEQLTVGTPQTSEEGEEQESHPPSIIIVEPDAPSEEEIELARETAASTAEGVTDQLIKEAEVLAAEEASKASQAVKQDQQVLLENAIQLESDNIAALDDKLEKNAAKMVSLKLSQESGCNKEGEMSKTRRDTKEINEKLEAAKTELSKLESEKTAVGGSASTSQTKVEKALDEAEKA